VPSADSIELDATNRLFVRNLAYALGEDDVRALFEKFGAVDAVRITRRSDTHASKGFGYVEFKRVEDAVRCVEAARAEALVLANRTLSLDWDTDQPKRGFKDAVGRSTFANKAPKLAKKLKTATEAAAPATGKDR